MHWVIQDRIYETGFEVLKELLVRFDIPHDIVKVVPFSHELIPEIEPKGLVMACGGTTLSKIAIQRGWTPGTFLNDDHDYRQWERHYGAELLNAGSTVSRFADVVPQEKPFFIRPCTDGKAFTGMVTDWPTFSEWQHKVVVLHEQDTSAYMSLTGDTMVSYGPVRTIYREYRFFIVDGRAVTQSVYKVGTKVMYSADVEPDAIAYANRIASIWGPARAYCLDICLTPDGYRVMEINCINSAGFYAIDIPKFVDAIESMEF
jgi:hypothetical protein